MIIGNSKACTVLPVSQTATHGIGLTMMAWDKGRSIVQTAAWSRGIPRAHNTVWDPSMAIKLTAVLDPQTEIHHTAAWDLGVEGNDPMVWHPGQKSLLTKSTLCSQSPAGTGLIISNSKPCTVLPLNHTVTCGMGLVIVAMKAWGEGRSIVQTTLQSRGMPIGQAQTHTSGTIGTATMWGTGQPLKHPATGGLDLPIVTTAV